MPTSFKQLVKDSDKAAEPVTTTPTPAPTASKILAAHGTKDKRMTFRISTDMADQFATINRRRGAAGGSVLNMLIAEYILEHKDLLD